MGLCVVIVGRRVHFCAVSFNAWGRATAYRNATPTLCAPFSRLSAATKSAIGLAFLRAVSKRIRRIETPSQPGKRLGAMYTLFSSIEPACILRSWMPLPALARSTRPSGRGRLRSRAGAAAAWSSASICVHLRLNPLERPPHPFQNHDSPDTLYLTAISGVSTAVPRWKDSTPARVMPEVSKVRSTG